MKRVSSRVAWLERRVASKPARGCPECTGGEIRFVVLPPRVIGDPEPPRPVPRPCPRCGKPVKNLHFVVKPPREIGRQQGDAA